MESAEKGEEKSTQEIKEDFVAYKNEITHDSMR